MRRICSHFAEGCAFSYVSFSCSHRHNHFIYGNKLFLIVWNGKLFEPQSLDINSFKLTHCSRMVTICCPMQIFRSQFIRIIAYDSMLNLAEKNGIQVEKNQLTMPFMMQWFRWWCWILVWIVVLYLVKRAAVLNCWVEEPTKLRYNKKLIHYSKCQKQMNCNRTIDTVGVLKIKHATYPDQVYIILNEIYVTNGLF